MRKIINYSLFPYFHTLILPSLKTCAIFIMSLVIFANQPIYSREIYQEIVVKEGDTLWSIANKYLKDPKKWYDIAKINNLPTGDPTIILPNTRIKVPLQLIKEKFLSAELIKMIPKVRYKRKGSSNWKKAKQNMTLNYEDSLRTLKGGLARVKFPSKEVVQINENSYVVLKPEKILQEIQLIRGDIRASRAKIIMPQGTVVMPRGAKSDFRAAVRDDKSELVFVYKGKVDVTAQGKTVTVPEGFGTTVPKSMPPMKPQPLPTFKDFDPAEITSATPIRPKPQVDPKGIKVEIPKLPGKMRTQRRGDSKVILSEKILSKYSLQVAKSKNFKKILLEKIHPTGQVFDINKENIPDGNYFMRVAFIDPLGQRGQYSKPTRVTKDSVAPIIKNVVPNDNQTFHGSESYIDVIGTVEGATYVSVNDEVVFLSPTGRFQKFLTLKDGVNLIRILARDVSGNETLIERKITYNKKRKK